MIQAAKPSSHNEADAVPVWEQCAAFYVLMMLTGALIGPVLAPDQVENTALRLFWLPSYAVTAGLCMLRWRELLRVWPAVGLVVLMALLAFASKYWSIDPETTQRRVIALSVNTAFATYLGARYRGVALPRLLAMAGLWMGVLSVLFVILLPHIGVHHGVNDGLWRGIWYEKNQMGLVMVACAVGAASWLAAGAKRPKLAAGILVLCSGLALATASKTSLVCLMLGLGTVLALTVMRRGGPVLTIITVWCGVVVAGLGLWLWTMDSATILALLGKDPTLTGRTEIWAAVARASEQHPALGYGYNAFWGKDSVPANWIRHSTGWDVPSAHHGWLDILLELGWTGAILTGGVTGLSVLVHLFRVGGYGAREGWWSLAYLGIFILLSLSESVVMTAQNLPWVLCIAALARAFDKAPLNRS
ncbi:MULTISPECIES: O-antigen ligase family protein [unclassified Brevundimonas]|uniref:O-antigen ligase family protein n=1 Tax=unclassified Brevundimonas TaxID=2622653 RepID=UPI0025C2C4ED|nr:MULTISPECIES: O-antigen ligase [unclassified Brevundimonas]